MQPNPTLLIPFLKFEQELENELLLKNISIHTKTSQFILLSESLNFKPLWAQDVWSDCTTYHFTKKTELVSILKKKDTLGVYFDNQICKKQALSALKEIRNLKIKRIDFAAPSLFNFKYFTWTLLDESTVCICTKPSSQFPIGWHEFNENKNVPPNRAYLKLWELLTLGHISLKKNDVALEVGSSPGGWTWVLSELSQKVYSIDKAPLDKKIAAIGNIHHSSEDAFLIDPDKFQDCNWLFSDIICTPQRLYDFVKKWRSQSNVKNYVCTIKFKGPCDFEVINQFAQIPNSKIIHLYQNKNEVTWINIGDQ